MKRALDPTRRTPRLLVGPVIALLAFASACGSSSAPTAISTPKTTPAPAPAPSPSSSTSTPTTKSPVTLPEQNPAELAACAADAESLETALAAYQALKGAYPTPPAAWSAATYVGNYLPLTTAMGGGPFMPSAPATKDYVIEYDAAGHVWVAPPGAYGPYDKGQDFATYPDICDAAVG